MQGGVDSPSETGTEWEWALGRLHPNDTGHMSQPKPLGTHLRSQDLSESERAVQVLLHTGRPGSTLYPTHQRPAAKSTATRTKWGKEGQ